MVVSKFRRPASFLWPKHTTDDVFQTLQKRGAPQRPTGAAVLLQVPNFLLTQALFKKAFQSPTIAKSGVTLTK